MWSDKRAATLEKVIREDLCKEVTLNEEREQTLGCIWGKGPADRTECTWRLGAGRVETELCRRQLQETRVGIVVA